MDRREFIKTSIFAALGFSAFGGFNRFVRDVCASEPFDLMVARGSSPAAVTEAAISGLGGMGRFVSPGDRVVVKPNIGWDRRPEQAANTNPEVVASLVTLCYAAGAGTVHVFDHTVNDARRCYRQSGIEDAARAAGAVVDYIDKRKFRDVKLRGYALREWPLYGEVLDADAVINVPVAKTHGIATLTLGMKNLMGVMGGWRFRIHQKLDGSLVDVALAVRPVLTVLDAVRILTAQGPQGGDPGDVKKLDTVIAGVDPVAVDAYGATLFGMEPRELEYLGIAEEAGLGTMNFRRLKTGSIVL